MKRVTVVAVTLIMVLTVVGIAAAEMKVTTTADLELFYELSEDVSGDDDNDKIKSNQLYYQIDGKSDDGYAARLKLDGADIVNSDGDVVTEAIIEEANFTFSEIGGSPIDVCFGKDEQPFGLDYDKYLNDSIAHQFEIDKVWGINATATLGPVVVAAGTYEHRHSDPDEGETLVDADNNIGDNYAAKISTKAWDVLDVCVSGASESYADVMTADGTTDNDDETRWGAGAILSCPKGTGNINVEYISFQNMKGMKDYDPGLLTVGIEYSGMEKMKAWGRIEFIDDDASTAVEDTFWSIGVSYSPIEKYSVLVEYSNFNTGDMKDATDLMVADGSIEDALLIGVKATY